MFIGKKSYVFISLFSAALLITFFTRNALCEDLIRAKVGIQIRSGDRVMRAKSRDRLKTGDYLRLYVHPEHGSYVYVIHSDQKTATLLNTIRQTIQSSTLVMPSLQQYYQVDGKSKIESFTIICSPNQIDELSKLFKNGSTSHKEWEKIKKDLSSKSEIQLASNTEKPFAIAGNVRGAGDDVKGDPFSKELQVFSGKTMVLKHYEFRVK
jgi:hypothetical protein